MLEFAPLTHELVHFEIEEASHPTTALLGAVERDIGIVAQRFGAVGIGGIECDADADPDGHRVTRDVHFLGEDSEDALREQLRVANIVNAALDDKKLVAADPGDEIDVARDLAQ